MTEKRSILKLLPRIICGMTVASYLITTVESSSTALSLRYMMPHQTGCLLAAVVLAVGVFAKKGTNRIIGSSLLLLGLLDTASGLYWCFAGSALRNSVIFILMIKSLLIIATGIICLLKPKCLPAVYGTGITSLIFSIIESRVYFSSMLARIPSYAHIDNGFITNITQDDREWRIIAAALILSLSSNVSQVLHIQKLNKNRHNIMNMPIVFAGISLCSQIALATLMILGINVYSYYYIFSAPISFSYTGLLFFVMTIAETAIFVVTLILKKRGKFTLKCGNIFFIYFFMHQFFSLVALSEDLGDVGEGLESLLTVMVYIFAAMPTIIVTVLGLITVNIGKQKKSSTTTAFVLCLAYCSIMAFTMIVGGAYATLNRRIRLAAYLLIIIKYISMGLCTGSMLYNTAPHNK